jgi:hypothetical protein
VTACPLPSPNDACSYRPHDGSGPLKRSFGTRPPGTTSERGGRPCAGSCFSVGEQPSSRPVGRSWRSSLAATDALPTETSAFGGPGDSGHVSRGVAIVAVFVAGEDPSRTVTWRFCAGSVEAPELAPLGAEVPRATGNERSRVGSRRSLGARRTSGAQLGEPQSRPAAATSASISSIVSDRDIP